MQVIDIEQVTGLAERARDTDDIIGHQAMLDVGIRIDLALTNQTGHLSRFILQLKDQVPILGITRLVDQAYGTSDIVEAGKGAPIGLQFCDFTMSGRQASRDNHFADSLQAAVEQ